MIEQLMMTTFRIGTFDIDKPLTNATGFLFQREARLFLVTANHVVYDEASRHFPSRLVIEFHVDGRDMTRTVGFSMPLYDDGKSLWRGALDGGGLVDVAVLEIDRAAMPANANYRAFTPGNIPGSDSQIDVGSTLVTLGFPMGFHDALHHLPVARQAGLASSWGIRFQGNGYFLVDARTHRGISGAPVVMRMADADEDHSSARLPWRLLGVHSSKLEAGSRDPKQDDALGLNAVWYADILLTLTQ